MSGRGAFLLGHVPREKMGRFPDLDAGSFGCQDCLRFLISNANHMAEGFVLFYREEGYTLHMVRPSLAGAGIHCCLSGAVHVKP